MDPLPAGGAVFRGTWAGSKNVYVVRPGAPLEEARRAWESAAAATTRPRWQRVLRGVIAVLAFLAPIAAGAVLVGAVQSISQPVASGLTVGASTLGLALGVVAAVTVLINVFPSGPSEGQGATADVALVPPELAKWLTPTTRAEDVWALATQMGRMQEVAAAWFGSGRLFEEHLRPVIADRWARERSTLVGMSEPLRFSVPEAYAADDPSLLAVQLLDG